MPGHKATEATRREQILKAAYEVALRRGIDGLTVRAVAARARLSHGLVLFHFKRKDQLGLALLDRVLATTLSLLAVFVPVSFMGGIVGRFLRSFGLTMACASGHSASDVQLCCMGPWQAPSVQSWPGTGQSASTVHADAPFTHAPSAQKRSPGQSASTTQSVDCPALQTSLRHPRAPLDGARH